MPKGKDFLWIGLGLALGMFVVPKVRSRFGV